VHFTTLKDLNLNTWKGVQAKQKVNNVSLAQFAQLNNKNTAKIRYTMLKEYAIEHCQDVTIFIGKHKLL